MPSSSDDDGPTLRKWSEHGLGHLLNPGSPDDPDPSWATAWKWILDPDAPKPPWAKLPAMSRTTASTPRVLRAFEHHNASREPEDRVRPFNFLLSVTVAPFGHPEGPIRSASIW